MDNNSYVYFFYSFTFSLSKELVIKPAVNNIPAIFMYVYFSQNELPWFFHSELSVGAFDVLKKAYVFPGYFFEQFSF